MWVTCLHSFQEGAFIKLDGVNFLLLVTFLLVFLVAVFDKNSKGIINQTSVCILGPNPIEDITNTSAHTVNKLYQRNRTTTHTKGRTV